MDVGCACSVFVPRQRRKHLPGGLMPDPTTGQTQAGQSSFVQRNRAPWVYFVTLVIAMTRPSMETGRMGPYSREKLQRSSVYSAKGGRPWSIDQAVLVAPGRIASGFDIFGLKSPDIPSRQPLKAPAPHIEPPPPR
ncbi:hypothetical protein INR49_014514 [Caranx melampygus]|nr:hypothetical protein INR49_014514 [Caranx melampygus]